MANIPGFLLHQNMRGWAVFKPMSPYARIWAATHLGDEANDWARQYGDDPGEYWLDPRDAMDAVEALVADGFSHGRLRDYPDARPIVERETC